MKLLEIIFIHNLRIAMRMRDRNHHIINNQTVVDVKI